MSLDLDQVGFDAPGRDCGVDEAQQSDIDFVAMGMTVRTLVITGLSSAIYGDRRVIPGNDFLFGDFDHLLDNVHAPADPSIHGRINPRPGFNVL
jgi:hypothetical protein